MLLGICVFGFLVVWKVGDGLMLLIIVSFVVIWLFLMFFVKFLRIEFWKIFWWNMWGDVGRDEVDMMVVIDLLMV